MSPLTDWFCSDDNELSDVEDELAAAFENGIARGLNCRPSAGVDDPRELGDGEGFTGGTADGDGGSKSAIPSLCSTVSGGI